MLISVFAGFGITADAEEWDVSVEYFYDDTDNTAEICGLSGKDAHTVRYLDLPTTVGKGKYTVTSISEYAFYGNQNITEVTIPDTVTSIDEYAFYGCSNLASVDLGNSVQSIGKSAFAASTVITVHMPVSLKSIGDYAFDRCANLSAVFYRGSESQLNNIYVGIYNVPLSEAEVYVNSSFCADGEHDMYWMHFNESAFIMCGECGKVIYILPFRDLDSFSAYYDYVYYTSEMNSFLKGTNPPDFTEFSPKTPITRAMFVTILYRMAGEPYAGNNHYKTSPFTDITNTSVYYYDAACWALDEGITNQTTFKPFDNVSREQTASFLFRYAEKNGHIKDNDYKNVDLTHFSDYKTISPWAEESLKWCAYNGLITGTQQGTANPQGATQRIHATKILFNFGKACNIGF